MGKKQKKSGEDSAKDDDIDIDALAAEIEGAGASKEPKGKKKKKGAKKEDFDEDDILKELEEMSLETAGRKAKKPDTTEEDGSVEPPRAEKKKTRKGKKGEFSPEDEEGDGGEGVVDNERNGKQEKAPPPPAAASESDDDSGSLLCFKTRGEKRGDKKPSGSDEEEDDDLKKGEKEEESDNEEEFISRRDKKKNKGKAAKSEDEEQEDDGSFKIKTAAQKKAEKKEREKKKKEEDRMKQKKRDKEVPMETKKEPERTPTEAPPLPAAAYEQEGAEPVADDEAEGDKKKKDKKKKKGEKEEKEKKKGPSKATVKAMQEALARMKEEEERAKQEEEEQLKRLEELEKQRQEQERLEQERKEKKKQKEKERKERLKKEGKLLTKAQREARARAEATLKVLQAQGVEVPSKDSLPKKKPVYGDKWKKKKNAQTSEETSEVTSPTSEMPEPVAMETEAGTPAKEPEVKPDAAVDDWEAIASDEEKELKKVHIEVKGEAAAPPQLAGSEEDEEEDDEEEEEDEEDEEDEDESEEAQEEEKESMEVVTGQGKRRTARESEGESSESEDDDGRTKEERLYDRARRRIEKRRAENLKNVDVDTLRAPVVCVLGHVDTGKTKILDKLRHTHVQDSEAGGITQQIGATNVPKETIEEQTRMVKSFDKESIKIPGMLIIDTPGHESFSNLRNRGSSLCDIAILVVDIMHGLEPQTLESINLLKDKKCPFIVALNKIDRLYDWKKSPETDVVTTLKKQKKNTKDEFDERAKAVIVEFAQQGLNAALFFENKDPRTFVSLVPTSAHSGDGMGNLIALLVELTQTMLARRLAHCDELRAQVMEVKALPGMGTTIDVILINGRLREGETIIVPGVEGPIVTQIRGLLLPPPLKELRVKNQYEKHKEVSTSQGVKILGKDLEKALAGLPLLVALKDDEVPVLRDELVRELKRTLSCIKLEEKGVYVQASTLGSLEALLEFLRTSKVPYAGINIGPVHKKDVMKASTMLEHDPQYVCCHPGV
ncbi:eukaryotic translation initiation factor 5B isoform 2-T2 [Aulostomus maculatus]